MIVNLLRVPINTNGDKLRKSLDYRVEAKRIKVKQATLWVGHKLLGTRRRRWSATPGSSPSMDYRPHGLPVRQWAARTAASGVDYLRSRPQTLVAYPALGLSPWYK